MKKIITTTFGILFVLYMLILVFYNNFNIGILIPMIFGVIVGLWCYLPSTNVIKWLKRFFILCSTIFIAFMVFIAFMANINTPDFKEDAVIVLGCGLHGNVPSRNLVDRLDKAVEYSQKNPNALIVVSGGQGPQETCSEAEAMKKYLVDKGIDSNKIVEENKSTSTNENYQFSKAILDNAFDSEYTIVYITNSFHSYRAGKLAKINGLNPRAYNAKTKIDSIIPNYAREVLAVIQLWVFGR